VRRNCANPGTWLISSFAQAGKPGISFGRPKSDRELLPGCRMRMGGRLAQRADGGQAAWILRKIDLPRRRPGVVCGRQLQFGCGGDA